MTDEFEIIEIGVEEVVDLGSKCNFFFPNLML
jgi:hypothetical protein